MEGVAGGEQGEEDSGGKHTPAWGALRPHRPPLQLTRPPWRPLSVGSPRRAARTEPKLQWRRLLGGS